MTVPVVELSDLLASGRLQLVCTLGAGYPGSGTKTPVVAGVVREARGTVVGYELRAEYAEGASPRSDDARVETWHMTKADTTQAMCGVELDPAAETRPAEAWGSAEAEPFCRGCGASYLRQGP
ncbi:hypothetical protein ACGFX8_11140 [Streptomyces sp. NPDC048362]|uniref:hypothetical protein n=1 Tax=Streptomyces sp. NPDC048362 TaxID=3365539 RepID=UPI0037225C6E